MASHVKGEDGVWWSVTLWSLTDVTNSGKDRGRCKKSWNLCDNLWQYKDRKFQYQNIWVSAGFVLTKKVEENHMWTLQFEIINRHCTAGAHCNELCVKIPAKTTSLVFYTFNMIADIFISVFIDIGIMLAKKHIVVSLFLKLSTVAKNPMPASWIRCLNH